MKAFSFKVFSEGISFKSYNELKFYGIPEICFTGRSNVGKSSLINAITNRKSLASTSNKPGHTRKIFFYNIAKKFMLVDLPGYGYVRAPRSRIEKMSELVFLYLTKRSYLKIVYILIDSRHGFKESDISFLEFLDSNKISFQIVFTKIDKINKKEKEVLIKGMQFHQLIRNSHPFFTSSKTKLGVKDIKKQIIDNLKKHE
jgi:GTP-binding protein